MRILLKYNEIWLHSHVILRVFLRIRYHFSFYLVFRILVTGDFIFSSAYDKTAMAWLFDTNDLDAGHEADAYVKTFKGHTKGIYPLVFIPAEETVGVEVTTKGEIHPGDILITGSADQTARSWSFETGGCLKV